MSNIGTVEWYNPNKGYGFITPEDQSKDIFVHSIKVHQWFFSPLKHKLLFL